jgi:acyl-CoA thioesterase-1
VVTLGDSVPAGTACDCDPFPSLYAEAQHANSVNLAVPGYRTEDVLNQLPSVRANLGEATTVLLMIGANDLGEAFDERTPLDAAAGRVDTNVTAIVTAIEQVHRVPVVIVGYWNVVLDGKVAAAAYDATREHDAAEATRLANDALRSAAARTGATFVPTDEPFHGNDGRGDATPLLAPDGDHPDAQGHQAIAALLPPLRLS